MGDTTLFFCKVRALRLLFFPNDQWVYQSGYHNRCSHDNLLTNMARMSEQIGKDRTGLLAALVLSCCGASVDEIVSDYMR